jgi:hypothetical protein
MKMKVYIVQEIEEYKIYKVPENLIQEFEEAKKESIVVSGKNFQEVLIAFDAITKVDELTFNSELVKYRAISQEKIEEEESKNKLRLR